MKRRILKISVCFCLTVMLGVFVFTAPAEAYTVFSKQTYPKVAAMYLNSAPIDLAMAPRLAKFDVLILNMQAQFASPYLFAVLRRLNPNMVLLAYTSSVEFPRDNLSLIEPEHNGAWSGIYKGIQPQWFLKTYQGKDVSFWPGHVGMNLAAADNTGRHYYDFLAEYLNQTILGSGLWDGLLFDTVWDHISWVNENIDIDNDGRPDSKNKIDDNWFAGQVKFYRRLRSLAGKDYLLIINGIGHYHNYANGRMFEGFPEYWENGWRGSMKTYALVNQNGYAPRLNIINSDTDNSGNWRDFKTMRFGLASTLLLDGYFSFDYGTQDRAQVWWYDEYELNLGSAKTHPYNLAANIYTMAGSGPQYFAPGVWRRDFQNGVSLVNSTGQIQVVDLKGDFEKIHGSQDKTVNNGAVVSQITLAPNDGIVLLRPILRIDNNAYLNGSFNRVYDYTGKVVRTGFFTYEKKYYGNDKILIKDLDNNGSREHIVARAGRIMIYDNQGGFVCSVYPYDNRFRGGINFAVGDLDGDGKMEIVTGTENYGGPHIRVFNRYCRLINPGFFAYGAGFRGGVNLAVGDLNGDGTDEIIVGAGVGGGPHIRIFNKDGRLLNGGFFAYNKFSRQGVKVAVGDVNGDGRDEIVTLSNQTNSPVKVFNQDGVLLLGGFYPKFYHQDNLPADDVDVLASDLDGNGRAEIIISALGVFGLSL